MLLFDLTLYDDWICLELAEDPLIFDLIYPHK